MPLKESAGGRQARADGVGRGVDDGRVVCDAWLGLGVGSGLGVGLGLGFGLGFRLLTLTLSVCRVACATLSACSVPKHGTWLGFGLEFG